jgi:hypothetical protein
VTETLLFEVTPDERDQLLEQRKLQQSGVRLILVHLDDRRAVRSVGPRRDVRKESLASKPSPALKSCQ